MPRNVQVERGETMDGTVAETMHMKRQFEASANTDRPGSGVHALVAVQIGLLCECRRTT